MIPNLSTLALSPGNVLVRCPECASLFRRTSPTGCATCGDKRKRKEEKEECECKKECACDDVDVPDPKDPSTSKQWKNAWLRANGYSSGLSDAPEMWMVEAYKREIAKKERAQKSQPSSVRPDLDPAQADERVYESGCRPEDCEPVYESGCPEDCEPVYESL